MYKRHIGRSLLLWGILKCITTFSNSKVLLKIAFVNVVDKINSHYTLSHTKNNFQGEFSHSNRFCFLNQTAVPPTIFTAPSFTSPWSRFCRRAPLALHPGNLLFKKCHDIRGSFIMHDRNTAGTTAREPRDFVIHSTTSSFHSLSCLCIGTTVAKIWSP